MTKSFPPHLTKLRLSNFRSPLLTKLRLSKVSHNTKLRQPLSLLSSGLVMQIHPKTFLMHIKIILWYIETLLRYRSGSPMYIGSAKIYISRIPVYIIFPKSTSEHFQCTAANLQCTLTGFQCTPANLQCTLTALQCTFMNANVPQRLSILPKNLSNVH